MRSKTFLFILVIAIAAFLAQKQFFKSEPSVTTLDDKPRLGDAHIAKSRQPQAPRLTPRPLVAEETYTTSTPPPLMATDLNDNYIENVVVRDLNFRMSEKSAVLISASIGISIPTGELKSIKVSSLPELSKGGVVFIEEKQNDASSTLIFDPSVSIEDFLAKTSKALGFGPADLKIDPAMKIPGCSACVAFSQKENETNYAGYYVKNPFAQMYYFYRVNLTPSEATGNVFTKPLNFTQPSF